MANNHEQFIAFNDTIKASKSRRDTLKKNRESIRKKIRNYFKNNWPDKIQPQFHWQGSYSMYTLLNPIKDEDGLGAYDLDDGIYFIGSSEDERETVQWYHNQIYEAVKAVSQQHGYDMVVDRASAAGIIFANPRIDISDEILRRLGYSN